MPHSVSLYRGEHPLWLEHPELGPSCDVVAIPMERPASRPEFMHNAANRSSKVEVPVEPGCTVFIGSFSQWLSVGLGLPFWKSGYVSSEPCYDVDWWKTTGVLRIVRRYPDTGVLRGRANASGNVGLASVHSVLRHYGTWDMKDPYGEVDPEATGFWNRDDVAIWGSQGTQFVGCNSGRVMAAEGEAALGLCFRTDTVQVVCGGATLGSNPHLKAAGRC